MKRIEAKSGGCPESKSACLCTGASGHPGPHTCTCGGSWDNQGNILTFPLGIADPVDAMFAFLERVTDE